MVNCCVVFEVWTGFVNINELRLQRVKTSCGLLGWGMRPSQNNKKERHGENILLLKGI
jgi:hypothetical protein